MAFWNLEGMGSHTFTQTEIENVIMLWTPGSYWFFVCRGDSPSEWLQGAAITCDTCICRAGAQCNLEIRL